jgi:hypothetical protein
MPHPSNITDLVGFTKLDDQVLRPSQWQPLYGFTPEGANFYVGVFTDTRDEYINTGQALNAYHQSFFQDMVSEATTSPRRQTRVVLGLEPLHRPDPFGFVTGNLNFVAAIADALAGYQAQALAQQSTLDIVVRFASEMNDPGNHTYGLRPAEYRDAFVRVRTLFRERAPQVSFCFSPALRRDLRDHYPDLPNYWPGDEFVDVIAGTWYVGNSGDFSAASDLLRRYCLHRLGSGKPFGIDELGGRTSEGLGFDLELERMFEFVDGLATDGVQFLYGTVFIQPPKWSDARTTLEFLR